MKKFLILAVVFLFVVITFTGCSDAKASGDSAEYADFSLHAGTKFGMSAEEVTNCEKSAGYSVQTGLEPSCLQHHSSGLCVDAKIAGVAGSAYFHFKEDVLDSVIYMFGNSQNEIRDGLISKYGNPVQGLNKIACDELKADGYAFIASQKGLIDRGLEKVLEDYAWSIPIDGENSVVINYSVISGGGMQLTFVGYEPFPTSQINGISESINNDL